MGDRLSRWWGLAGLAIGRVTSRASGGDARQVALTVTGVAIPVALVLVVSGVSLGLATGTTVRGPGVDYWIVPDSAGGGSAVVDVGGAKLGDVHAVSERLSARDDVAYVTPVELSVVRLSNGSGTEYVLAVGVVPRATPDVLAGTSTAGMTPGDPHYANGSYDGPYTDQAVLSTGAAELLGVTRGDALGLVGSNRTLTVANVSTTGGNPVGGLPVMLLHLSELQSHTGAAAGDQADQLLVMTNDPAVKPVLEGVYPGTHVLARGDLTSTQLLGDQLPLAMAAAALVVALVVGVLSAASTMGMAVAAGARRRAVMAAIGVSSRSRAAVVSLEALVLAVLGGGVGVLLGAAGVVLTNAAGARWLGTGTVAEFHPAFVGYGLGIALLIGLVTVPYLLLVSRRTTTIAALRE